MFKCIICIISFILIVGCQKSYMSSHAYRNKLNDYHQSQVIPPLNVADQEDMLREDMYPVPAVELRGDSKAPDLWPPLFPKKSS